ncbi:MAG: ABC transporter permease [Saprospiraceae bacterium]|nr:ABC transporter permease [Saprospiraceae bacterium]MCB9322075.1 ABC transporter permease [Lewinellaceae bacterium]
MKSTNKEQWLRKYPRWVRWILGGWFSIALLVPFIANERGLMVRYQGQIYFPVFHQWGVDRGIARHEDYLRYRLHELPQDYQVLIGPLVPYRAETLDAANSNYRSPFGVQESASWYYRHWLGTDQLGRDALAGLLYGARTAWWVGMLATALSVILGLFFGLLAGYYGNDRSSVSRASVVAGGLLVVFALILNIGRTHHTVSFLVFCSWWALFIAAGLLLYSGFRRVPYLREKMVIPFDRLFLAVIGWFKSLPGLVVVMAVLPLFKNNGIWSLALLIGLFRWPLIGQYVRAEVLRIRHLPFMESVRLLGLSDGKILIKHALPNVWPPVIVNAAFGVGAAVAVESALSFLGLGLGLDQVTWGTMMNVGRNYFPAWWLTFFPGLALFMVVYVCNVLGDRWLARYNS